MVYVISVIFLFLNHFCFLSIYRPQRGRSATSEGIYSNSYFLHAATSNVGNIVQVQTQSGTVFEGVYRTFSPQFQVSFALIIIILSYNKNHHELERYKENGCR